jgi:DhnA family fructose-bisphosphate aldolase class Ia
MQGFAFNDSKFLPEEIYRRITDIRIGKPGLPMKLAKTRVKRLRISKDGKLTLLAADHTARMVTTIRNEKLRMGNRKELLSRILRVLACSPFDGLLGTPDIMDRLLILEHLSQGRSKDRFLNKKILLGSINRGGLAESVFELDDRPTGYDTEGIRAMNLDGAKFLLRFDPNNSDTAKTLQYCVDTIRECTRQNIPIFVEPLPVAVQDDKVKVDADPERLIKLVGVVSALGSSSTRIWLKLPYCDSFEQVARATTLPILLLGGEASDNVGSLLTEIQTAMNAASNVRGVLMGRNLLYPTGDDPLPLAHAVHSIVHEGVNARDAESSMREWEGKELNVFSERKARKNP